MHLNEQQYWKLISEGDKNTFELVFKTYYQVLSNYACSVIKDIDDSEEIVQNLFYNIWEKREVLQVTGSLKSYLYRAVYNDCLNKMKHAKVRALYAEDYRKSMRGNFADASKTLQAKELGKQINEAIESLPQQCGTVFKLSRFDNLKYAEIAYKLNISVKTVENHMGKALKVLRERLKDHLYILLWLLFMN